MDHRRQHRRAPRRVLVGTIAVALAVVVSGLGWPANHHDAAAQATAATELLPDLNPLEPRRPEIASDNGHWVLAFGAATDNLGAGPLMVHGVRTGPDATMEATQIVQQSDGTTVTYPNVGTIVYVVEPDHQHWHFLGFMTYELRTVSDYQLVRPGQKTGFCLTDDYPSASYDPNHDPPGTPAAPVYTQRCDLGQPDATSIDEGLSVGYGDYYNPLLEGQSIDLTGVPDGRYYLIVRSNASRALHESDYSNNGASLQLVLTHPNGPTGEPALNVVMVCRDSDHCPRPVNVTAKGPASVAAPRRSVPISVKVSLAATVSVRLTVNGRRVAAVQRKLGAGVGNLSLKLPKGVQRPATAFATIAVTGPGLQPAKRVLRVRLTT